MSSSSDIQDKGLLVTGATGFIGSHLVRELIKAGHRPTLLARSHKPTLIAEFGDRVRWLFGDLADADTIAEAIQKERPAMIFHLAGSRDSNCSELNFMATKRLLDAASRINPRRIIIMGSAEEYGKGSAPFSEEHPLNAESPYGIWKAAATCYALMLHRLRGCPVIVIRPFTVYGPGQPRNMFIAEAIDCAIRNVEFKMSSGEQKRDLVFIDDIVHGLMAAASAPNIEGKVINLGAGRPVRLKDLAKLIWRLSGSKAPLAIGARNTKPHELYDLWADITLARQLLGWEPRIDLETGLRITIDFARDMPPRTAP